jgi:hypothetical protein
MRDCGAQDVDCWTRQLRAAGWVPVRARTGQELPGSTVWRSPSGHLYRGPYGAWCQMLKREEYDLTECSGQTPESR